MHLILFLIGTVVAFAGALLVLYAVPVVDVAAAALFTSGIFAIVGALILMALAAVARSIGRIAERLEVQPLAPAAVPPVATVTREEPPPRAARVEPAPPPAPSAPAAPPADEPTAPLAKKPSPLTAWLNRMSPSSAPAKPAEEPVVPDDLALLAKMPEEPPPMVARDPIEPPTAPTAAAPPPPPAPSPPPPPAAPSAPAAPLIPRAVAPASRPVPRSPPVPTAPEATVYKSGVIDGMAYTLFMDGSIEAELPQGRVRFASVDELQKYLTNRP